MPLHEDGKAAFDDIYTAPDPRRYFATLHGLDYQIPQLARPHFARLIAELRGSIVDRPVTVLDIGCSYGVNPALLRCGLSMSDLYERYAGADGGTRDTAELLAADRALVRDRDTGGVRFVGLDASAPALSYARRAGFLDHAVLADLERGPATAEQRADLSRVDLVVSTGCVGYITERTIGQVIEANAAAPPWMAHFVLRMYPFAPLAACLAGAGYHTVRVPRMFRQRRFASLEEQSQVLDTLRGIGEDPTGLETDGWLYAQLFISRPATPQPDPR